MNNEQELVIFRTRKWYEWRCKEVMVVWWYISNMLGGPAFWSDMVWLDTLVCLPCWDQASGVNIWTIAILFQIIFFFSSYNGNWIRATQRCTTPVFSVQFPWLVFITVKINRHSWRNKNKLSLTSHVIFIFK